MNIPDRIPATIHDTKETLGPHQPAIGNYTYDELLDSLVKHVDPLHHRYLWPQWLAWYSEDNVVAGRYGIVNRAQLLQPHPYAGTDVAVKKLRLAGNYIQRFRTYVALGRELAVWSQLKHENIAALVGFHIDVIAHEAWLISLWETYGDILTYLDANQPDEETRFSLAQDTINGLAYLHSRDPAVCHGDLKGANTLINRQRRAVLCDFGTARAMATQPTGLTTNHDLKGTTHYMSPQLINDNSAVKTLESDIWAWGCLFYEIMRGIGPYQGRTIQQVVFAMMNNEPPAHLQGILQDVNQSTSEDRASRAVITARVLQRCWMFDPAARPTALWCFHALRWGRTSTFFDLYTQTDNVPSDHVQHQDDLTVIRNPNSNVAFDFSLSTLHKVAGVRRIIGVTPNTKMVVTKMRGGEIRLRPLSPAPSGEYELLPQFSGFTEVVGSYYDIIAIADNSNGGVVVIDAATKAIVRLNVPRRGKVVELFFCDSDRYLLAHVSSASAQDDVVSYIWDLHNPFQWNAEGLPPGVRMQSVSLRTPLVYCQGPGEIDFFYNLRTKIRSIGFGNTDDFGKFVPDGRSCRIRLAGRGAALVDLAGLLEGTAPAEQHLSLPYTSVFPKAWGLNKSGQSFTPVDSRMVVSYESEPGKWIIKYDDDDVACILTRDLKTVEGDFHLVPGSAAANGTILAYSCPDSPNVLGEEECEILAFSWKRRL